MSTKKDIMSADDNQRINFMSPNRTFLDSKIEDSVDNIKSKNSDIFKTRFELANISPM